MTTVGRNKHEPGVYAIINSINGKVYIGSAQRISERKSHHFYHLSNDSHASTHLQRSFNKYGKEHFVFIVLELVDDLNNLSEVEQKYIDFYESSDKRFGYNLRKIAESNREWKHSEETKIKMSEAKKGITPDNFNEALKLAHESHKKPVIEIDQRENIVGVYESIK